MKAPFPYFGGKARIAARVWQALGDVDHYVEPFAGSLAALLARPDGHRAKLETVNDADGMIANFWRAVHRYPDAVAKFAKNPVFEVDLVARHRWLIAQRSSMTEALKADLDWCDPRIAGYWVWGIAAWYGKGFASAESESASMKLPILGQIGRGVVGATMRDNLPAVFAALSRRLQHVRVASGDWMRVVGSTSCVYGGQKSAGVFLDPPYATQHENPYDTASVDHAQLHDWCVKWQDKIKIVLAGYDGEYDLPGWTVHAWEATGGFALTAGHKKNAALERLWMSPMCNRLP
jgi:site-specific DNA-adenine methylase